MGNRGQNMFARDSRQQWLSWKGWAVRAVMACFAALAAVSGIRAESRGTTEQEKKMTIGAYYFDGWAGHNQSAEDAGEPWSRNAPTQLTRRMVEEFPQREPVWGWRDDSPAIMERQIDLAADHGLAFFAFCWYWHDNGGPINEKAIEEDPKHTGLELFLKARNSHRMKFCLLVANHDGFEIKGTEHWKQAADFWMRYLKDPQCVTVGGKPLVIIFNPGGGDKDGFAYLQEAARKMGLPGVAIAGCGGGTAETGYTHRTHYNVIPGYTAGSEEHKYAELVAANREAWGGSREQPYMPEVIAGWDKRPWESPTGQHQRDAWYYPDRTPEQFAMHLRDAMAWMDKHPEQTTAERIVLIYAWNELGEGGYMVPTKGDPEGDYLKALRSVVMPDNQPGAPADAGKPLR
jgi:hypothetical protein